MKTALITLAAVLAGLIATFLLVIAVEYLSNVAHPFPEGTEQTMEAVCQHVERYPAWILAVAIPLWAVAAFAGTWTAQRFGNLYSAAIVGLLVLAALIFNISMLPYPIWFKIGTLLAIPAALVAGSRLAISQKTAAD